MKKRIIAVSLAVCMLIGAAIPAMAKSDHFVIVVPDVISLGNNRFLNFLDGKELATRYVGGNLYYYVGSGRPVIGPGPRCKLVVVAIDAVSRKQASVVSELLVNDTNFNFEVPNAVGNYEIQLYGTTAKEFDTLLATTTFTVVE
ncbi:MAG: hypothetical protein FWG10_05775 [Eubacteriaceae bacterium]|nr:hypothetical protein [Eubacteriaceae bacterium]